MKVLVANVGSTSLKYRLIEMADETTLASGGIENIGTAKARITHRVGEKLIVESALPNVGTYRAALRVVIEVLTDPKEGVIGTLEEVEAVGFKAVHAGRISGTVIVDDNVLAALNQYAVVAPAHNIPYAEAMRTLRVLLPRTPLVAVFETGFHRTMPPEAYLYGLPYEWYESHGIRRYGFHGASHRYVSERAASLLGGNREDLKVITAHLGGSSSLCAVKGGRSIDTSMGFSPQSGVSMSNRHGDIDFWIVPFLMQTKQLSFEEISRELTRNGGLAGISGLSGDVRELEEAAAQGHERAALALDLFCYEVKKQIGAFAAAMGGLDALVFTGGIGERGTKVRQRICHGLEFLGIAVDPENEPKGLAWAAISPAESRVKVFVIPTNEELVVARETARLLAAPTSSA